MTATCDVFDPREIRELARLRSFDCPSCCTQVSPVYAPRQAVESGNGGLLLAWDDSRQEKAGTPGAPRLVVLDQNVAGLLCPNCGTSLGFAGTPPPIFPDRLIPVEEWEEIAADRATEWSGSPETVARVRDFIAKHGRPLGLPLD